MLLRPFSLGRASFGSLLVGVSLLWLVVFAVFAQQTATVYADIRSLQSCMEVDTNGDTSITDGCNEAEAHSTRMLSMIQDVTDWIRQNGGTVDARQQVRYDSSPYNPSRKVFATATIPQGTTLLRVPWDLILSSDDPESEDLCHLVHVTHRELQRYLDGTSALEPYMRLLFGYTQPMRLPDGWTKGGKELLATVVGDSLPPRNVGSHLLWYRDTCEGDLQDEMGVQAALLVVGYRSNGFKTPDTTASRYQEAMMPFFDVYSHRDGPHYNTQLQSFQVGADIVLVAARTIQKGEAIHGSVGFGTPLGTPRLLMDGGIVEELPRYFSFPLVEEDTGRTYEFTFQVEEPDSISVAELHENQTLVVKWPNGRPTMDKAMDLLQEELERLEALQDVLQPDAPYVASVPKHERELVAAYHAALVDGIRNALLDDIDPFSWSPFTQTDYVVAGVNLGTYKMGDEEDDLPTETDELPFELYEDFYIGDLVQGNEGWQDILNYRNKQERKSWSFYVDKVARKRWLPTMGFDQPRLYALHYGSEISETGTVEDEMNAIYKLLPNETDFAAKPSHFSETNGIWLVSRDLDTNETIVSSTARQLIADETAKSFDNWVVARSLAKDLHGIAKPYESWALKNVNPGFVVEERLVDFHQWDRPPLELCIFVIWGRVWCGQMNYIEEQHRFFGAFIYRNGTTVKGSFHKNIPFDWLDWSELVRQAEELGKHKDMFRADFFVGIPASSPSLRNGTYEDKVAALRIVVSESEIYPTTTFHSDSLPADAARLWIAGYKKGNYKLVRNDEVPKEFLETGRLGAPPAKQD